MKGYISHISLSQLNKLREDFWSSRVEDDSEILELLNVICSDNSLNKEEIENIWKMVELFLIKIVLHNVQNKKYINQSNKGLVKNSKEGIFYKLNFEIISKNHF